MSQLARFASIVNNEYEEEDNQDRSLSSTTRGNMEVGCGTIVLNKHSKICKVKRNEFQSASRYVEVSLNGQKPI